MRIRSIKPEFYRSADIAALDWETRFLFIALWSYVDDNGVGIDRVSHIAADLFADDLEREPSETLARVTRGLQKLAEAKLVTRYEATGKRYVHVANWLKHQRIDKPNKERYPAPEPRNGADFQGSLPIPELDSRETPESPATGTEEQRNRGTEERKIRSVSLTPDEFTDWYLAYPRHEGRAQAEKAYTKARATVSAVTLLAGAKRYASDPNREQRFTKLPATWLNGGCWDDDPLPPKALAGQATSREGTWF